MKIKINENAIIASNIGSMSKIERTLISIISKKVRQDLGSSNFTVYYNELYDYFPEISKEKKKIEINKLIYNFSMKSLTANRAGLDMYRYWFDAINNDKIQSKIIFKISSEVKPYFLLLSNINIKELDIIDDFKSKTAKILYIYLFLKKDNKEIILSYEEAKNNLYTGYTDIKINDLFRKHIDKAIDELNEKTNLNITYKKIKDIDSKKYCRIKFLVTDKQM